MASEKQNNTSSETSSHGAASTGNASNPSPQNEEFATKADAALLNDQAEKYLRESASIEDLPDAEDQQTMDEELGKRTDS